MTSISKMSDLLSVSLRGVEVLRYVYLPDTIPFEGPKPYFHPVRTLAGDVVTGFRPHDHRWHRGLQMTASHVSGENFWGGGSYVRDQGYVDLPNVGTIRHEGFDSIGDDGWTELLGWYTQSGEHWISERRRVRVREVSADAWALDFGTELTNVRALPLEFGSPTTNGRENAGYSGLFWRGPRSFTEGRILAADGGEGPEMMGRQAGWLAYVGQHDEVDHWSTLVFMDVPANGTRWFVRNTPFAAVNPSLAFSEEVTLPPGETMVRSYRIVIADGAWDRDRLEGLPRPEEWS
jgi:hypothetical protein